MFLGNFDWTFTQQESPPGTLVLAGVPPPPPWRGPGTRYWGIPSLEETRGWGIPFTRKDLGPEAGVPPPPSLGPRTRVWGTPLPMNRQTTENITFSRTSYTGGKNQYTVH